MYTCEPYYYDGNSGEKAGDVASASFLKGHVVRNEEQTERLAVLPAVLGLSALGSRQKPDRTTGWANCLGL